MVYSLLLFVNIRAILAKHQYVEVIHLCIDRNIQPNVTAGKLKLDYVCTSLHSPLSFKIDNRLEDSF